jgi:hypothetical protein
MAKAVVAVLEGLEASEKDPLMVVVEELVYHHQSLVHQ